LCTRVVALCPPVLVIRRVDESAVLPADVHPDNAGLPVVSDTVNDPREIVSHIDGNGVVGHPAPTGVIRVVTVPLRVDIRVLRLKESLVINGTKGKLRRPTNVPGDDTDTDEIADIEDVLRRQLLTGSPVEELPEFAMQLPQRLRTGRCTPESSNRLPGRSNLRVVEPRVRCAGNQIRVDQSGNRVYPALPTVLDHYAHLNATRRQHCEPVSPLEVKADPDTEHRRFHQEAERLSGLIRRHIPRRHKREVQKSRTVLLLVDQRCPHHPETTTGRSPLEVEHPIKGILCGPLRLSVIPRKPVSLHVVFLDREHTLDDSTADVNPRFLTAVLLNHRVRP